MNLQRWKLRAACLLLLVACALRLCSQALDPAWTRSLTPHRIAGNLFYVGTEDLAAYLIVTAQGNILINSTLEQNVPQIKKNVETLGFSFEKIKILLISHAHYDHCAGSALVKQMTGAKYYVMEADVSVVESGGKTDYQYANNRTMYFPPTKVDHVLHDGDTVKLAQMVLTAHLTAGHTRGTTTWTFDEMDDSRPVHVVIVGGPNMNAHTVLVGNKVYPRIASDFQHGFDVLKALPCDVFLGAHGGYFGLKEKYARLKNGEHDVFIDPEGYKAYIADREQAFQEELKRQQARAH
jgi:metallo-beta-lactamase class B